LPCIEQCTDDKGVFTDDVDVVVTFDCSDGAFVDGLLGGMADRPKVVNIDHHDTNPLYGDINQVVVEAPAAAEVVYRFFLENDLPIAKDTATCLLTGVCFDTTVLSNSGANRRAFEAASDLLKRGARANQVMRIIYQNRSVTALRLWGVALARLRKHPEHGHVTTVICRKDIEERQATDEDLGGLSDFLNLVTDTDTLFVIRETRDGGIKVSMRSQTQNVAKLAAFFGGGGHKKAAGFTLDNAAIEITEDERWRIVERV
jgi:phosphoesterase RecJ-like protein